MRRPAPARLYGVAAEFDSADAVLAAARAAREQGYRRMDAYSPFPVEGLAEAVAPRGTPVPLIVLVGGLAGGGRRLPAAVLLLGRELSRDRSRAPVP